MMPQRISRHIVTDKLAWIQRMLSELRALPLQSRDDFFADRRNSWAAESCLRRALEAMFDLGRHILAKGFAIGPSEYKEIAQKLGEKGILNPDETALMRKMAGYRNRMVHFYDEISEDELYEICAFRLGDIETVIGAIRRWLVNNSDQLDDTL